MPTASIAGETLGIGPRNSRLRRWVLTRAQVAGDWVMLKGAGCTRIQLLLGAGISKELTMIKSILAVTILALSTSGALIIGLIITRRKQLPTWAHRLLWVRRLL